MIVGTAFRAGRRIGSADPTEVSVEGRTVARTKLSQGRTVSPREVSVRDMDRRSGEI